MSDIKEGNLVRISLMPHPATPYEWQRRVGLVLKKDICQIIASNGHPTSIRWTCNFAGEVRSVSVKSLEKVQ